MAAVDMNALVRATLMALRLEAGRAEVRVDELPEARADLSLLGQVWVNLLGNALKYSSRREAPLVEVGARREGRDLVYWVRDNGEGFDMRYAAKLFEPFQRLHREDEFPGVGVGLANVRRIVERHGGRVWAEGRPGEGAAFYFTLPAA
jgi:light-regulated signal transduction histidine kinase (bacteriophytochrome)